MPIENEINKDINNAGQIYALRTILWHALHGSSLKEFWDAYDAAGLTVTADDLEAAVETLPSIYGKELEAKYAKRFREEIWPFRLLAQTQVNTIDISDAVNTNQSPVRKTLDSANELKAAAKKKFSFNKKKETNNKVESVINTDGTVQTVVDTQYNIIDENRPQYNFQQPPVQSNVFVPQIEGNHVNIDVQHNLNMICGLLKDRLPSGTLIETKYSFGDFYTAIITFVDGTVNTLTIDAKTMLPDYYGIVTKTKTYGTIMVPIATGCDNINKKLITTPLYELTEEETKEIISKYYLADIGIYYCFDLSSLKGLRKLSKKNKERFQKILSDLGSTLRDVNTNDVPRFRFKEFNWINDFVIISDDKVKSPLRSLNETSPWIVNCEFTIKNGKIVQPGQENQQPAETKAEEKKKAEVKKEEKSKSKKAKAKKSGKTERSSKKSSGDESKNKPSGNPAFDSGLINEEGLITPQFTTA